MKKRRILINNDFYNIFQVEPPVTDSDVLAAVDRLAGTQVDTLFLMTPTGLAGRKGDFISPELIRLYEHPETDPSIRNLMEFCAGGKDPFGMLVERAKQRGLEIFASFRMNDTHYLDQIFNPWIPLSYYDNLHHRVGPGGSRGGAELDYRKSAVRNQVLAQIRDAVIRYPVDGVEMDCTRNCMFFPRGSTESGFAAECAPVMTDFVRQVRGVLDEAGMRVGRRIHLCATIPGSLYHARSEGLDIPLWARLGYLDLLCLSSPFVADFDRDVQDTRLKTPGVQVYAGCDRNCQWPGRPVPRETYRAMTMNYLQQGADGIYLYNVMIWTLDPKRFPAMVLRHGGQGMSDSDRGLMYELGDPSTLEYLDKLYMVSHAAESVDRPYAALPVTVPASGEVTLRLRVGDDVAKAAAQGRIKAIFLQAVSSDCADYNNYTLKLNSVDLSRQYAFLPYADKPAEALLFPEPGRSVPPPPLENVRRHPVRPIDLHTGINYVTIKSYKDAMTITDLELAIRYQES
ncbi:MAG: hypothetical protein HYU36_23690 [Planctomycetes bacterium]|nr:hypothetical protein [Planctomycetota bacterium]